MQFLEDLAFGINFAYDHSYYDPKADRPKETGAIPTERGKVAKIRRSLAVYMKEQAYKDNWEHEVSITISILFIQIKKADRRQILTTFASFIEFILGKQAAF